MFDTCARRKRLLAARFLHRKPTLTNKYGRVLVVRLTGPLFPPFLSGFLSPTRIPTLYPCLHPSQTPGTLNRFRACEAGSFALRLYRNKRSKQVRSPKNHRRGRSFTLKKNVNSPTHPLHKGRTGDTRATVTGGRPIAPIRAIVTAGRRTTISGSTAS